MRKKKTKNMAAQEQSIPSCPFCEFTDSDSYFLAQHVELCHPEDGYSPFIAVENDRGPKLTTDSEERHRGPNDITLSNTPAGDEHSIDTNSYVECPAGCGEAITVAELPSHLDLHSAEEFALEEVTQSPRPEAAVSYSNNRHLDVEQEYDEYDELVPAKLAKTLRERDRPRKGMVRDTAVQPRSPSHKKRKKERSTSTGDAASFGRQFGVRFLNHLALLVGQKLSLLTDPFKKSELGPHANERQMPAWLRRMLEEGAPVTYENKIQANGTLVRVEVVENETKGLVPVLAQLCELDESVDRAYLCNPNVRHIFKMPKEGGFCGYRNIQMMISFIQDSQMHGYEHFPGRIPSILKLQDMIEHAWNMGFNKNGRIETGGIKGTRKYIGTSEVRQRWLEKIASHLCTDVR